MTKTKITTDDLTRLASLHRILEVHELIMQKADELADEMPHLDIESIPHGACDENLEAATSGLQDVITRLEETVSNVNHTNNALRMDLNGASEELTKLRHDYARERENSIFQKEQRISMEREVDRHKDLLSKSYDRNSQLQKDLNTLQATINAFVHQLGSKALTPLEMKNVSQGRPIEAIKSLRLASGCDLRTAKTCVDAYKAKVVEEAARTVEAFTGEKPIMPVMCKISCDGSEHPAAACRK